jgi:hypothetical protein
MGSWEILHLLVDMFPVKMPWGLLSPLSHQIVVSCVGKDWTLEGNTDA